MPGLEVRNLVRRLGDHLAVDDLSFSVAEGEFLVLLGPSGCGKTTTLRIICGLEQPDSGEVLIDDRPVTSLPSRDRNLGMVFQEYGLYPSMDVFGNMAYGLQARGGVGRKEIEERVRAAAEKLDLTPLLKSPITDLSGGEQQRVALGRAMVKDADAYLFDEPLSNLDPKLRYRLRRDIMALHREKGKPSVYVTHDQSEAFAMGDVVAVVANGKVQQAGPPGELVERPANTFVAGFVGTPPMNLLDARLQNSDGSYVAVADDASLALPDSWRPALARYGKEKVTVGIRPEAFVLGPENGAGTLEGEVTDVEPLIGETVVRLMTREKKPLAVVFRAGEEGDLGPGDPVRVGVAADGMRLFDADSAQALVP
ncbi:ABC transporter ATP-binding protein [Actinopolymorpha sp. B11F2]|uniref:ABC transporter ATP-binding protein n=1 Tax=Actinopolymorpha sp. B11F2 TaxID=3160862 RepID=UPI0032E5071E